MLDNRLEIHTFKDPTSRPGKSGSRTLTIEGDLMVDVSTKASEVIKQFLENREGPQSIRLMLNEGG